MLTDTALRKLKPKAAIYKVADALDAMSKGKAVETIDPEAGY